METTCGEAGVVVGCDDGADGVRLADCVVGEEQVNLLRRFLDICPVPEVQPRALTASYWAEIEACRREPANPVEALVGQLLGRADIVEVLGEVAGAEWWWQDVDQDDPPKVYHTDQNLWLAEDGQSTRRHPSFSSVLYLTGQGGPTVVFGSNTAVAVVPRAGRYFVFRGDRPHGVLWPLDETSEAFDRITLLLNWWRERPPGLCEAPKMDMPLSATKATKEHSADAPRMMPPAAEPRGAEWSEDLDEWQRQRLPRALRGVALSPSGCVAVRYPGSVAIQS